MRYENIYSSFPCPASGHFSAASRRVAPISACVFFQRVSSNLKCNKERMPSLPSQHFLSKLSTLCTFVYILIDFQVITQCRQACHLYALLSALCTFGCTCLHHLHACMHYLHNLITWSAHTVRARFNAA